MTSPSLNEPNLSQDDEDETLVDETPHDDQLGIDSGSGNGMESSRKRKRPTKKQAPQKKAKKGGEKGGKKEGEKGGKKGGKERAACWVHFDIVYLEDEDGVSRKYGRCKYCKHEIAADSNKNGTSGLRKHAAACDENPDVDKSQSNLVFQKEASGEGSVSIWKHDDARIKKALLDLIIVAELPFKLVENPVFIEYTNASNGRFNLPSRHKLSRDIGMYYIEERNKLLAYLSKPTNTVHLTTDTWTSSCQRVNYMVVTAHFIDDDWVMHKRIINLYPFIVIRGRILVKSYCTVFMVGVLKML